MKNTRIERLSDLWCIFYPFTTEVWDKSFCISGEWGWGNENANTAAHRSASKCINTHHRNSSNPTTKKSTIFSAIFSSDLRGVLEMEKEKRYFLLSVTNDIFCVLSRIEKVRKYIAKLCAREKENIPSKNYHFLLFDWFHPWWIAWREIKSRKSLEMEKKFRQNKHSQSNVFVLK